MVHASSAPTEYIPMSSPSDAETDERSLSIVTTLAEGWHVVKYYEEGHQVDAEDERDVQDSLEALKEPKGIGFDEFREQLGV